MRSLFFILTFLLSVTAQAQRIQTNLIEAKSKNKVEKINLFNKQISVSEDLSMNIDEKARIIENQFQLIEFDIQTKEGIMKLVLQEYSIEKNNSKKGILDENGYHEIESDPIRHYRGIVEGISNSWVTFSFSQNRMKGLIATESGNLVVDRKKNQDNYSIFSESEFDIPAFNCESPDFGELPQLKEHSTKMQTCPITLFWLADYDFFIANNFDYNTCLFNLDAIFNSVAALYQQEGISLVLGSRYAYTGVDQYNPSDIFGTFLQFGNNIHQDPNFLGHDLAMLINVDNNNSPAGYAVIDALCDNQYYYDQFNANNTQGRFAVTRILPYYYNYPVYSSTIEVISHEMGHNLGSRHTHWCGWPIGAIDGCMTIEPDNWGNTCFNPGPATLNTATLMSYCSIYWGSGVPLTNGFGYYPNQAITNAVNYYDACICSGLSIDENSIDIQNELKLFPNPCSGSVSFLLNEDKVILSMLILKNQQGQVVKELKKVDFIDVSELSKGIYFIEAIHLEQKSILKLIIE